jgi:hypothetical protein
MQRWLDWADLLDHLVTTLAVLVGGTWAYFKYVRGRTFASRAEVAVSGALYTADQQQIIKATVALKNTGASKLALERQGKVIRVHTASIDGSSGSSELRWDHLETVPVFQAHGWVESSETVTDEALIVVPSSSDAPLAYKLEAIVFGKLRRMRRMRKRGVKWTGDTILPAGIALISGPDRAGLDGSNKGVAKETNRPGTGRLE